MVKTGAGRPPFWVIFVAGFVLLSGVVALGWLRGADLYLLRGAQEYTSAPLDVAAGLVSMLGSGEVSGAALVALLAGLILRSRRALAGRILAVFVVTLFVELVVKLILPQEPLPPGVARGEDFAPVVAVSLPYPYPSGHALRAVILFGAVFLLLENRLLRAGILVVLSGLLASRVYLGTHWPTDVVGGVLLGVAGLLWAFGEGRWRLR